MRQGGIAGNRVGLVILSLALLAGWGGWGYVLVSLSPYVPTKVGPTPNPATWSLFSAP